MRICVIGDPQDLSAVYIGWLARRRKIEVLELPEETLGVEWMFALELPTDDGWIEACSDRISFSDLNGAFVRLNPDPGLPPAVRLEYLERGALIAERRSALHCLLGSLPCRVANRPSAGRANGSKPYQMRLLADAGFDVPKWVATNDPTVASDFEQSCSAGAIYKSCSGLRSRVRKLNEEMIERLRAGTSPVVVQEYIAGRDVRVHTANRCSFATEVISPVIDYRFEHQANTYKATAIPPHLERLCIQVAEQEGLTLAGFDFRATDEGRWYCLEVNPMPTFLPYEMATRQPIGNAVLDALLA